MDTTLSPSVGRTRLLGAAASAALLLALAGPSVASAGGPHESTICHDTGSATNPWVEITVGGNSTGTGHNGDPTLSGTTQHGAAPFASASACDPSSSGGSTGGATGGSTGGGSTGGATGGSTGGATGGSTGGANDSSTGVSGGTSGGSNDAPAGDISSSTGSSSSGDTNSGSDAASGDATTAGSPVGPSSTGSGSVDLGALAPTPIDAPVAVAPADHATGAVLGITSTRAPKPAPAAVRPTTSTAIPLPPTDTVSASAGTPDGRTLGVAMALFAGMGTFLLLVFGPLLDRRSRMRP